MAKAPPIATGSLLSLRLFSTPLMTRIPLQKRFATKRRKTALFRCLNQWLAWPKCFGISGPFCSLTGSNPVGDAKSFQQLTFPILLNIGTK